MYLHKTDLESDTLFHVKEELLPGFQKLKVYSYNCNYWPLITRPLFRDPAPFSPGRFFANLRVTGAGMLTAGSRLWDGVSEWTLCTLCTAMQTHVTVSNGCTMECYHYNLCIHCAFLHVCFCMCVSACVQCICSAFLGILFFHVINFIYTCVYVHFWCVKVWQDEACSLLFKHTWKHCNGLIRSVLSHVLHTVFMLHLKTGVNEPLNNVMGTFYDFYVAPKQAATLFSRSCRRAFHKCEHPA